MPDAVRLTRAQSKAKTRRALLAAGGDLFAEHGFNDVTVEAIVERAGFTRGAFYANFTDKADLFLTLLEDTRDADMERGRAIVESTPDEGKLDAIQAWYDTLGASSPWSLAYAEFWPRASRDTAVRARLAARAAAQRDAITGMLEGYCAGEGITLPIPATEVGALLLALAEGIVNQRYLDKEAVPADAFTRGMALLWFGLMSGEAALLSRD